MNTPLPPSRQLKAPLYAVSQEWEHNGYDDSDFYRVMFDPNTSELKKIETHSTRYGCGHFAVVALEYAEKHNLYGPLNYPIEWGTGKVLPPNGKQIDLPVCWYVSLKDTPPAVWEIAEQKLADGIFNLIRAAEHRDILEPENANHGQVLRLTEPHKYTDKKSNRKFDLPAGTVGEVFWCGAFGTFYRNGYKQPNRTNRRVGLRLLNGDRVFVPLSKCRLNKEPLSDAELRDRAVSLAKNRRFEQLFGRVF